MASCDEFYERQLRLYVAGKLSVQVLFDLGHTPEIGNPDFARLPIWMPQSVLHKFRSKHGNDPLMTIGLPSLITGCVAVFRSATEADSFVIKLGLLIGGENAIIPVKREESQAFGLSYRVKSIYSKPDAVYDHWIKSGLDIYPKKK